MSYSLVYVGPTYLSTTVWIVTRQLFAVVYPHIIYLKIIAGVLIVIYNNYIAIGMATQPL